MSFEQLIEKKITEFSERYPALQQYTEKTLTEIKTHPLKSVLIAGGIGFLLSRLLRPSCPKK